MSLVDSGGTTTVDNRAVQLEFDNKEFERGISTSINSLNNLEKSLQLDGATKGLENISETARKFDMSGMSAAVEAVSGKFSALETVAMATIVRMTNQIEARAEQLVKSVSVDQIAEGWGKYNEKTASVQTIMNATGKSIDEVNQYLEKLMWFSDETSYSFTDMTASLGQLTASGADIDKILPMITGIANATAYAGKGTAEFSRAIYNLNQSYGSGALQLMDWKSLENAGVASAQLKQTLIDTAVALGTLKEGEVDIGSFNSSLADKWATSEVMEVAFGKFSELSEAAYQAVEAKEFATASEAIEALSKDYDELAVKAFKSAQEARSFSDAIEATKDAVSSGWMATFEHIFGNYDEAKVLWTDLANTLWDVFASGADARNEMLKRWKNKGGRDELIEAVANIYHGVASWVTPIKEAYDNLFPAMTSKRLLAITKSFGEFTEKLKIGEGTAEKIGHAATGVFNVIKLGTKIIGGFWRVATHVISRLSEGSDTVMSIASSMGIALSQFTLFVNRSGAIDKAVDALCKGFDLLFDAVSPVFALIFQKKKTGWIEEFANTNIGQKIESIGNSIKNSKAVELLSEFVDKIREAFTGFGNIDASGTESFIDRLEARFAPLAKVGEALKGLFGGLWKLFEAAAPAFGRLFTALGSIVLKAATLAGEGLANLADDLSNAMTNWDFDAILDAITSGMLIAMIRNVKNFFSVGEGFGEGIEKITESITGVLGSLKGAVQAWEKDKYADIFIKIGEAVALLAASLFVLSLVDSEKLQDSLVIVTTLVAELFLAMKGMTKMDGGIKSAISASNIMISMSTALLIMSFAMKTVAGIDENALLTGIEGMTAMIAGLVIATKQLSKNDKGTMSSAIGMIAIAKAVDMLADTIKGMAEISQDTIVKGLETVGGLLAELAIFTRVATGSTLNIRSAVSIIAIAKAVDMLSETLTSISLLSTERLVKGLETIGSLLLEMSVALALVGHAKVNLRSSIAIIAAAEAVKIMADALKDIAGFSAEQLINSVGAMAVLLVGISGALNAFDAKGATRKGTAMVIAAASLEILADVIGRIGKIPFKNVVKGLVGLGGSMIILAGGLRVMNGTMSGSAALLVAASALAILTPVLKALGGMSLSEIAKGLGTLAGVFVVLGLAGVVLGPIVPVILGLAGAIALIGVSVLAAGAGVVALSAGLIALSAASGAVAGGIVVLGAALAGLIPIFIKAVGEGIVELIKIIGNSAEAIATVVVQIVDSVINVIGDTVPDLAATLVELVSTLLGVLVENGPELAGKLVDLVLSLLDVLIERIGEIIDRLFGLMSAIFSALTDNIPSFGSDIVDFVGSIFDWIATAVGDLIGPFAEMIGSIIGEVLGGIVGGIMEGVGESLPDIGSELSEFAENAKGFFDILPNIDPAGARGITYLAEAFLMLAGGDFLSALSSLIGGDASLSKFGEELEEFGPHLMNYADSVKGLDTDIVENSALAAQTIIAFANNIPNEGGVAAWFAGDNSIAMFGEELPDFGTNLKEYSENVAGIDLDVVTNSAAAAEAIIAFADNVPNEGGVAAWFAGENSLSSFGEELPAFGAHLKEYAESVSGLDAGVVTNSTAAAEALCAMADNVPNEGGVAAWFAGDNSLASFGDDLVDFGETLTNYYGSIKDIRFSLLTDATDSLLGLVDVAKAIQGVNTYDLVQFGGGLSALAEWGIEDFIATFNNSEETATVAIDEFMDNAYTAVAKHNSEFRTAGSNTVSAISTGMKLHAYEATNRAASLLKDIIAKFDSAYNDFYKVGEYIDKGLKDGINGNSTLVLEEVSKLVKETVKNANKGLGIKSPSRVFMEVGKYVDLGFARGIDQYSDSVYDSVNRMSGGASDAVMSAMIHMNRLIQGGLDDAPTIRPVLDLSDVRSGASELSSLLDYSDMRLDMSGIGFGSSFYDQNAGESELVNEIRGLRKELAGKTNDTYNINGITYDDGSNIVGAVRTLVAAAKVERRL